MLGLAPEREVLLAHSASGIDPEIVLQDRSATAFTRSIAALGQALQRLVYVVQDAGRMSQL